MNKQHRHAYQAIKEVCQNHHGWETILLEYVGVSRQAYHKSINREETIWEKQDRILKKHVKRIYEEHNGSVGAGKILTHLIHENKLEFKLSLKRVRRVMNELNLVCKVRKKKINRKEKEEKHIQDNILNQNFKVTKPNEVWLTDSTQIEYGPNKRYKVRLSGILDLYGRFLLGYIITPTETAEAEMTMFEEVFKNEGDVHPMVHTDRGSAYVANSFNKLLAQHKVSRSMSRPGTPYDNSPMERWWNDFKLRWMDLHPTPATLEELKNLVEEGIDYFNNQDRSDKINGLTPAEYRNKAI